jgi:hypothetical protein
MLKRKRITLSEALQALLEYHKIPIRFLDIPLDDTVRVVEQLQIYAYDAYFIVCARQQSCPLISLDGGLQTAARAAQINLVEVTPRRAILFLKPVKTSLLFLSRPVVMERYAFSVVMDRVLC